MKAHVIPFLLLSLPVYAASPNAEYYCGLSSLYPYRPVYTSNDTCVNGSSYGSPGDLDFLPKSAPLPSGHKLCKWTDRDDPKATINLGNGWAGITGEGWYQWEPRQVASERRQYIGEYICYFEDRGNPKNINDLKKDER